MLPKALFTALLASLISPCILTALAGCASEPIAPKAVASQTYAANFGWREVVQDGKTLYCSNVLPTGSHIAPGCLTISSRDMSDFLSGYVRVVSSGQELFCSRVHFRLDACYTRAQMHERLLASLVSGPKVTGPGVSMAGDPQIVPSASIYTSFNASGH